MRGNCKVNCHVSCQSRDACIYRDLRDAVQRKVVRLLRIDSRPAEFRWLSYGVVGGSLVFVRLVPVRMPIPISTITPTPIHVGDTPTRYAATARPRMSTMKPTR